MEDKVVLETNSKLPPKETKKKSRLRQVLSIVIHCVWVTFLSVVISASSQIIYNYSRYSSFFVNGESMYPTLNKDVTYEGNWTPPEERGLWGDFTHAGTYYCDYGLMDNKDGFISKFERFDIAVTYYPNDFSGDTINSSASLKIKRLIGLPGDTIYFNEDGDLFINDEFVEQPFSMFYKERTTYKNARVRSTYAIKTDEIDKPITLGDDQYFLVGDNRNYNASDDSRFIGPISSKCIQGKAVAITAKCKFEINQGKTSSSVIWNTLKMPWDMVIL